MLEVFVDVPMMQISREHNFAHYLHVFAYHFTREQRKVRRFIVVKTRIYIYLKMVLLFTMLVEVGYIGTA